ncbi:hypothetical protein BC832DRAFT_589814 [Gaertneriomyces semiglobifer]|nr:hypothetical protein BC832DRAFT_589814 [Gaertneriomyces semiglobifer]
MSSTASHTVPDASRQPVPDAYKSDCLPCRITGTATALGLSTYLFWERSRIAYPDAKSCANEALTQEIKRVKTHRGVLAGLGIAFAAAGVYRAVMPAD